MRSHVMKCDTVESPIMKILGFVPKFRKITFFKKRPSGALVIFEKRIFVGVSNSHFFLFINKNVTCAGVTAFWFSAVNSVANEAVVALACVVPRICACCTFGIICTGVRLLTRKFLHTGAFVIFYATFWTTFGSVIPSYSNFRVTVFNLQKIAWE